MCGLSACATLVKTNEIMSFSLLVWRSDPATVNITDEMSKGSFGNVWKSVNPAESAKKEQSAKRLATYLHC